MAKQRPQAEADDSIRAWLARQPKRKAMQEAVKELRPAFREHKTADLRWWYQVGTLVVQVKGLSDNRYGLFKYLAANMPGDDRRAIADTLHEAGKIVRQFPNWSKLSKWAEGLSVMHVRELLRVADEATRDEARQLSLEGMSAREVARHLQGRRGYKKTRGGRHRKPRQLTTPLLAAQELGLLAKRWLDLHGDCQGPLKKKIRKTDREAFLQEAERAIDRLEEVARAVAEEQRMLKSLRTEARAARKAGSERIG